MYGTLCKIYLALEKKMNFTEMLHKEYFTCLLVYMIPGMQLEIVLKVSCIKRKLYLIKKKHIH